MTALRFVGQAPDKHPEKFSESSKGKALDGDAPVILLWLSERFCCTVKAQICSRCGQPLSTRYGVALSPMRLRLFDLIPDITSHQMATALYPAHDLKAARRTLHTQFVHINEVLQATDVRIDTTADIGWPN
jgi:hypothetical protein